MLALFSYGGIIHCAVVVVDGNEVIAYGARPLGIGSIITIVYETTVSGELNSVYGDSSNVRVPFGTAIYPLPAETRLPWEK